MPGKQKARSNFQIVSDDLFAPDEDEKHSLLWWILRGPGKILLWLEYMFPDRVAHAIGSARRRRSPIVQVWYSICFYLLIVFGIIMLVAALKS